MIKYKTRAEHGKLVFQICEGAFKGVEYTYDSLLMDGSLKYKLKAKKNLVNEENRLLFEHEIRSIINDKLSKL